MTEEQAVQIRMVGFIKDERGRKVSQFDPVALYLLRRHDVINPEILRKIASEPGVTIAGKERAALVVAVVCMFAVMSLFTYSLIKRDFGDAPWARSASLLYFSGLPWLIWFVLKKIRFGKNSSGDDQIQSLPALRLRFTHAPRRSPRRRDRMPRVWGGLED